MTENALRTSKAVVVLWSKKSVQSRWVKSEATLADRLKRLAPAMIEPCERPIMFELVQTADLSHWKGDRADSRWLAFVGDVRRLVEDDGVARPARGLPKAAPAKPKLSRRMLVGGGAAAAVVVAGGAWALWPRGAPKRTGEATLAVLPFENQSRDAANAFMADGVAEDVLNGLQRVKGLRVIARTSSFALREQKLSTQEIGAKLGADVLVQGSVQQAAKDVRVRTALVDVKTGEQLWSQTFQKTIDDLFALQDEVTAALVAELPRALGVGRLSAPAARRAPQDPESFRNLLEADELWSRSTNLNQVGRKQEGEALLARLKLILDAELAKNPRNADALAIKASLLIRTQSATFSTGSRRKDMDAGKVILAQALAADPDSVEANTLQAELFSRFEYRWREAEELVKRALDANPNHAEAHTQLAYHCSKVGRGLEALPLSEIASRLDPINVNRRLGPPRILPMLGRIDEAIAQFRSIAFAGEPNFIAARDLNLVLMEQRDVAGMRDVVKRLRASPQLATRADQIDRMEAVADGLEGRPERHRKMVAEALAGPPEALYHSEALWSATVETVVIGDIERALDMFQLCIANEILYQAQWFPYGHAVPVELARHPRWMPMWTADPRLKELCDLRLDALKRRQFHGRLPDGTMVTPA